MEAAVTLADIRAAAQTVLGAVLRTPLLAAPRLSELLGCEIWLKLENQQFTGSFKERGALVKLKSLNAAQTGSGVIAMSAGNHAQGLAYHAQRLGIPATIVMPRDTPFTKVERTREFGARVVLEGESMDASAEHARELASREGLAFVHPYDDPHIIAGQGTVGLEMLEDAPELDMIAVPVGGGGLLSGIAVAANALKPELTLVGVEADSYPSMYQALHGLAPTSGGATIAEGIAVKQPGELTRAIIAELVEVLVQVEESTLEEAVNLLVEEQRLVAEGAGAAGIAALIQHRERFAGRKVGVVICGGNIDGRLLASVLMRGLVRGGKLVRLRIDISDRPGVLSAATWLIGKTGGNIVEVYHQRLFSDVPVKQAEIDVVIETRNAEHVREIIAALAEGGFPARMLSTLSSDMPALG
ncbi:MAG: threonine ammonia-lyase [SAR324 cluster bacterium]|nr:threonine ammonia-lyase [SAR324 cluster bacterium]